MKLCGRCKHIGLYADDDGSFCRKDHDQWVKECPFWESRATDDVVRSPHYEQSMRLVVNAILQASGQNVEESTEDYIGREEGDWD